jgi:transposase
MSNTAEIIIKYETELNALHAELNTLKKRCDQYAQAYDSLQAQVKELLRNRFGKKSERFVDEENPQGDLFYSSKELLEQQEQAEESSENEVTIASHKRKKNKKSHDNLPRRIEIIPVDAAHMQCACGCQKTVINYETKEILNYQPAVFEIIEQRREIVACPKGCEGQVNTAPAPLQILPKVKVSEELLSFLIVSKLDDRQPLYHLEKQLFERYEIDCSRQSMARWYIQLTTPLQPMYNLLKDGVIDYDVASCDATTLQVLREPGRAPETKSYVYCIRGGPPDKRVILYDYNNAEHKQFVKTWFTGFKGYLHVDGDNFFALIGADDDVDLVNCNAHARRKFEPLTKGVKGKGLALEALRFFKALYKIERQAKEQKMSPEQRYQLRQKESAPLLEKFKLWLDQVWPTVLPQSALGKAIKYCLNIWPGLTAYLKDGRLEIDNNLTEQEIKPFVIARKNFLFSNSMDGADALCMHFGLIRTAKLHGLDPYRYYAKLLKSIPYCKSVDDYENLLPWNIKLHDDSAA